MKRVPLTFGGLYNSSHETKIPVDRAYLTHNCQTEHGILEARPGCSLLSNRTSPNAADVCEGAGYGKYTGNEVQRITSTATSGTATLTWSGQTTSALNFNAKASEVQAALEALSNINIGDVRVSGGDLGNLPLSIEFRGQYANTDVAAITVNSTLAGGSWTVSEYLKGGAFESYFVVIQPSGSGTCTLYGVTSNDNFGSNFTWTSIATGLSASNWFFQQYGRIVYACNATDGLLQIPFGGTVNTNSGRPTAPNNAPTNAFASTALASAQPDFTSATFATTGFANAPTLAVGPGGAAYGFSCVINTAAESNVAVSITVTLNANANLQYRDFGFFEIFTDGQTAGNAQIDPASVRVVYQNSDGTTNVEPPYYGRDQRTTIAGALSAGIDCVTTFNHAGNQRTARNSVKKITVYFTIKYAALSKKLFFLLWAGDNFLADTLNFTQPHYSGTGAYVGAPTVAKLDYAYSYYKTSSDQEGSLSPALNTDSTPLTFTGHYSTVTLNGNKSLLTSDKIYVYRREKATGRWRKLPNADGTYGVANVTSGTTTFVDHNWEYELANYPEPFLTQFSASGLATSEQIGAWKGSLVVGGNKQAWFSRVGAPNTFAPSPDDNPDNAALIAQGPSRAVTIYVAPNRSENVYNISGQDALYVSTDQATYMTVVDQPSDIIAMRPLRSSRGSTGYRAVTPYNGGVLVGTKNGLWQYRASRYYAAIEGSNDEESELTRDVRRSWDRLTSQCWLITFNNNAVAGLGMESGTWTLTFGGVTSTFNWNDSSTTIKKTLEDGITSLGPHGVDCWCGHSTAGVNAGGIVSPIMLRFMGQKTGVVATSSDLTVSMGTVPHMSAVTVTLVSPGGYSNLAVAEYIDNIWCFNGSAYLWKSRTDKWNEGAFTGISVHTPVATRANGLVFFSTLGKMYRIEDKATSDATGDIYWWYETGWSVSSRQQLKRIEVTGTGQSHLDVTRDDAAGGLNTQSFGISEGPGVAQGQLLNVNVLPGRRHKFSFYIPYVSLATASQVHTCDLTVEDAGDGFGS